MNNVSLLSGFFGNKIRLRDVRRSPQFDLSTMLHSKSSIKEVLMSRATYTTV